MAALNYATEYSRALSQAFPYVLYFGALYSTCLLYTSPSPRDA